MKLEQALEEYRKRKRKAERELEKLRSKYDKRLQKRIKEILRRIDSLEKKEIPKNVDENIKRIVSAEKRNYVRALRKALESIRDIDELGKRLPDLAKLHVGHGKYLLILFEKDVYAINKLLKELNEDYVTYYREFLEKNLEDLRIEDLLREEERTKEEVRAAEREKESLEEEVENKKRELDEFYARYGIDKLEEDIKRLHSQIKSYEMEIRSKASKLQKPIKRMRLHEEVAEELVRDSSVALRKPEEVISLLRRIYPKLDGKYKKAAQWLIENLEEKHVAIVESRKKLSELERERDAILHKAEAKRREILELERLIEEKESEIRKLKRQLEHLEKELEKSLEKLEEILGQRIER